MDSINPLQDMESVCVLACVHTHTHICLDGREAYMNPVMNLEIGKSVGKVLISRVVVVFSKTVLHAVSQP